MGRQREILKEYARMRDNGLDAKAALNVLRPHIEGLNKSEREELAAELRAHEQKIAPAPPVSAVKPIATPPAPPPPPPPARSSSPSIRPIQPPPIAPVTPPPPPPPAAETPAIVWVNCPNCGKTNQKHEVFCYSCGQMLEPVKGVYDTRTFSDGESEPLDSEFFGPDSVLVLRVRGTTDHFEIRPQKSDHEMIIGRSTQGSAMAPDVDLKNTKAADLGVSRLHLTVRYDSQNNAILVTDLGSSNGSYINGQRMLAKEVRVLRHGDELRLGKLVLAISFRHPGGAL